MKRRRLAYQETLFETSRTEQLERLVRELDVEITNAMRRQDFEVAKEKNKEQKTAIQELVTLGDASDARQHSSLS